MFTIQYVKNLQWANPEHTMFDCIVKYEEFNEEHPSTIDGVDPYVHIREIWTKGNAGEYGEIAKYVLPVYPTPNPAPESEQPTSEGTQNL